MISQFPVDFLQWVPTGYPTSPGAGWRLRGWIPWGRHVDLMSRRWGFMSGAVVEKSGTWLPSQMVWFLGSANKILNFLGWVHSVLTSRWLMHRPDMRCGGNTCQARTGSAWYVVLRPYSWKFAIPVGQAWLRWCGKFTPCFTGLARRIKVTVSWWFDGMGESILVFWAPADRPQHSMSRCWDLWTNVTVSPWVSLQKTTSGFENNSCDGFKSAWGMSTKHFKGPLVTFKSLR